jgi:hypothetical protein
LFIIGIQKLDPKNVLAFLTLRLLGQGDRRLGQLVNVNHVFDFSLPVGGAGSGHEQTREQGEGSYDRSDEERLLTCDSSAAAPGASFIELLFHIHPSAFALPATEKG